jgi:hypothetical protein
MNARHPPIANFDSASAMLRATANYLHGMDFPLLGSLPRWLLPVMLATGATVNTLPAGLRDQVYIWSGWLEAIAARKLRAARTDDIAQWAVSQYPRRSYPAVAIGSSNGAAVHLWAALGIPYLPQTFLTPVARSLSPDDPQGDADWGARMAPAFLDANPDIQLHQLNDPNQDRLMIRRFAYFRTKRLRLGKAYEDFLDHTLTPGDTIILIECNLQWPTTRLGSRHLFQFGALGGIEPEEYLHGSARVTDYLERYHAPVPRWSPPVPDGESPEAEWGFEPALRDDVERYAREHHLHVRRLTFDHPRDLSPLVADLYEWWNAAREIRERRLLVESFVLLEPYWAIVTGAIPFWMVFNMQPSAEALSHYLDTHAPFDEIDMMLFSHGVDSAGLAPMSQWQALLRRGRARQLIGVDDRAYPRDFAVFTRYNPSLKKRIRARYPLPAPLPLAELDSFLSRKAAQYGVQWL